jgi:hypothetical protein
MRWSSEPPNLESLVPVSRLRGPSLRAHEGLPSPARPGRVRDPSLHELGLSSTLPVVPLPHARPCERRPAPLDTCQVHRILAPCPLRWTVSRRVAAGRGWSFGAIAKFRPGSVEPPMVGGDRENSQHRREPAHCGQSDPAVAAVRDRGLHHGQSGQRRQGKPHISGFPGGGSIAPPGAWRGRCRD